MDDPNYLQNFTGKKKILYANTHMMKNGFSGVPMDINGIASSVRTKTYM